MPTPIQPPTLPKLSRELHKGEAGRILVIGGGRGMLGAPLLAGEAALRCGSGMVTIASTEAHIDLPALRCAELMSAEAMQIELKSIRELADVLVLGPGLGQSSWGEQVFERFVDCDLPMVLDADGLNWLARKPRRRTGWVLTPHVGEAARLLGATTTEIQADRIGAVQQIAAQFGGICVLKGAGTLVAGSENNAENASIWRCDKGNPGMATAGMGDVLSGVIGAWLGQGLPICEAATTAVWLHSAAADLAAKQVGERSLLAGDVVTQLPVILKEVRTS